MPYRIQTISFEPMSLVEIRRRVGRHFEANDGDVLRRLIAP